METDEAGELQVLLQFKAGRMLMLGTSVRPDSRKGTFRVVRDENLLVRAQWVDRSDPGNEQLEEDTIVFPHESTFKKVEQSSGRVYMLTFAEDERKFFYWMQEPDASGDERLVAQVNKLLNQEMPDEPMDEGPGGGAATASEPALGDASMRDGSGGAQAQTLEEELGSRSGQAASSGQLAAALNPQPIAGLESLPLEQAAAALAQSLQMNQLRSLVSGLSNVPVPQGLLAGRQQDRGGLMMLKEPGLTELLTPQVMLPVLHDPQVVARLGTHLPEALQSPEEMKQLVQSPQFQQQLETLSVLLRSGRIDLLQFGIDPGKYGYGVISFLQAIQEQNPPPPEAPKDAPPASAAAADPCPAPAPTSAAAAAAPSGEGGHGTGATLGSGQAGAGPEVKGAAGPEAASSQGDPQGTEE